MTNANKRRLNQKDSQFVMGLESFIHTVPFSERKIAPEQNKSNSNRVLLTHQVPVIRKGATIGPIPFN